MPTPELRSIKLYSKSVLKQQKFAALTTALGPTDGLRCLDLGSDNGVISYLLRQRGGLWSSADLDSVSVASITELVGTSVYQVDTGLMPFKDDEFDRIVVVDMLEHIEDDRGFINELFRILKPEGILIVNVPAGGPSLLRSLRALLGQTDEKHGHVRSGYTVKALSSVLGAGFRITTCRTYSRFFSEMVDAFIVFAVSHLKRASDASTKGLVVTGHDLDSHERLFRLYSLVYPIVWLISRFDSLLWFTNGYMLVVTAISTKSDYPMSAELEPADHAVR